MPETEARFIGQLVIIRLWGRQIISGRCYTCCMLYMGYAVLGINSASWHGEIEMNGLTLCSAMMVKFWKRMEYRG